MAEPSQPPPFASDAAPSPAPADPLLESFIDSVINFAREEEQDATMADPPAPPAMADINTGVSAAEARSAAPSAVSPHGPSRHRQTPSFDAPTFRASERSSAMGSTSPPRPGSGRRPWVTRASSTASAAAVSPPQKERPDFASIASKVRERRGSVQQARKASKDAARKSRSSTQTPGKQASEGRLTRSSVRQSAPPPSSPLAQPPLSLGGNAVVDPSSSVRLPNLFPSVDALLAHQSQLPVSLRQQLSLYAASNLGERAPAPVTGQPVTAPGAASAPVRLTPGQKAAATRKRNKEEKAAKAAETVLISSSPSGQRDASEGSGPVRGGRREAPEEIYSGESDVSTDVEFQPARRGRRAGTGVSFEERADAEDADEDHSVPDSPANRPQTPDYNPDVDVMNLPNPRGLTMAAGRTPCLACIKIMAQDPDKECTYQTAHHSCDQCRKKRRGYCQPVSNLSQL